MDNGTSSYRRFLDGDESAFDEIMKEVFRSLVFFVDGYVHIKPKTPAHRSYPSRLTET